jgi:guanylate kinase
MVKEICLWFVYSKAAVQAVLSEGKVCVLDIDMQGVKKVKQLDMNPLYIFIMPPSMEELECRLRERGTETEESLQRRLDAAREEIAYGECYHKVGCINWSCACPLHHCFFFFSLSLFFL